MTDIAFFYGDRGTDRDLEDEYDVEITI